MATTRKRAKVAAGVDLGIGPSRTVISFVDMQHAPAVVIHQLELAETAEVYGALVKIMGRFAVSARADVARAKALLMSRGARAVVIGATFVSSVSVARAEETPAPALSSMSSIEAWFERGRPKDKAAADEWLEAEKICMTLAAEVGL